jgi:hypothetical protein
MVRRACGRNPDDVSGSAHLLLTLLGYPEAAPEQVAAAHVLAFGLLDLRVIAASLMKE